MKKKINSGSSTTESATVAAGQHLTAAAASTAGASAEPRRASFSATADLISVYSEYLEDPSTAAAVAAADRAAKTAAKVSISVNDVTVPISLSLAVIVSYICGGALLFSQWEGWGFLDGSYFCFITLSTIGFGDFVPGDAVSTDEAGQDTGGVLGTLVNTKFILCSMYILIGMAVIAMCFNLMQQKVVHGVRSMGRKIGIIKD